MFKINTQPTQIIFVHMILHSEVLKVNEQAWVFRKTLGA